MGRSNPGVSLSAKRLSGEPIIRFSDEFIELVLEFAHRFTL